MMFFTFTLLLLIRLHIVFTCGTSTHISIAHEAATFYQGPLDVSVDYASIIQKHSDAFVAGNPYPDAMYPSVCFGGKYHEVAEDTHWAPFLNATVNYIRKNYPQPWDESTEKLVAFMFGYISHQVADISWHSLAGFQQGFLQAMANVNFHGNFDAAHTDGDVGGDMLTQFDNSDQIIPSVEWYVPVDDLYQIYKEFYKGKQTVPKEVIELCSQLLYIEYVAETFAGAKTFKPFVKRSPFLLNQLDNYFLGGVHDMAAWTSKIWNETVHMLEHGTSQCNMERSTMHVNCTGYLPQHAAQSDIGKRNPGRGYPIRNGGWNISHIVTTRKGRGIAFAPGDDMKEIIDRYFHSNQKHEEGNGGVYTTEHSYSQIGRSISTININNKKHVVISAPTYSEPGLPSIGKVWIIPAARFDTFSAAEELSNLDAIATRVLKGRVKMGRFGWAVNSGYYDQSSDYEDLLISAPSEGGDHLQYAGTAYVYNGSSSGLSPTPDTTLNIKSAPFQPPSHAHTNFGFAMSGPYFLTISAPFYKNQTGIAYYPQTQTALDSGSQEYSWYGYSRDTLYVNVPQTYVSLTTETVGAPNFRLCHLSNCSFHSLDVQTVGQLRFYVDGELRHQWTGESEFEELGYSSAIFPYGRFVAIGSPGYDVNSTVAGVPVHLKQAGKVDVYYFPDKFLTGKPELLMRLLGDRSYGRFGDNVQLSEYDGFGIQNAKLIVGAPRRTKDFNEEIDNAEEGAVFIYSLSAILHAKEVITMTTEQADRSFIGEERNARFGSSVEVVFVNSTARLIVGATTSSKYGFKTGLIHNILLH